MANKTSGAQKAAYLFLVMCCGAVLAFGGWRLYLDYGPSKVTVGGVPYGLPAGTTISRGDAPDMTSALSDSPIHVQTELRRAAELFRAGAYHSACDIYDGVVALYPDLLPAIWGELNTNCPRVSATASPCLSVNFWVPTRVPVWPPTWKAASSTRMVTKVPPWN